MLFFSTTSATTFDSSLKQTREKKEKTLKPFSLFSFLSLILITTTLALLHKGREDEHALFFLFFFRVVKFYIEKDSKKRRAIDFDCFAHHPEAAAKNPKLTKRETFYYTHKHPLSLSRLIDTV